MMPIYRVGEVSSKSGEKTISMCLVDSPGNRIQLHGVVKT